MIAAIVALLGGRAVAFAQATDPFAPPLLPPPPPSPPSPPAQPAPKATSPSAAEEPGKPVGIAPAEDPDFLPAQPPPPAAPPPRPRRYPVALADRPLTIPSGVTELGLAYEVRTFVETTRDFSGDAMRSRGVSRTPDAYIEHAFGNVDIGIGAGQLGYGWIAFGSTNGLYQLAIRAATTGPQPDDRYARSGSLTYSHKVQVAPRRLALIGHVSLAFATSRYHDEYDVPVEGAVLTGGGGAGAQVQLAPRFALGIGTDVNIPLGQTTDYGAHVSLGVFARLLIAFDTWDLYLTGAAVSLARDPATVTALGIMKRWGL